MEPVTATTAIAEEVSRICDQIGKYLSQKYTLFTRRSAQKDKPKPLLILERPGHFYQKY